MNYLNFIKSEDKKFFKEYNIKSRNFIEILKQKKGNSDINLNDVGIIDDYTNEEIKLISKDTIPIDLDLENEFKPEIIHPKKNQWLIWVNNSCRFDSLMTIYTFILYNYIENNNIDIKDGLLILHKSIKSLIGNPFSEERFNFWSFANNNQLDRGYKKLEFGDIGFISGLFSIFDNYENF